MSKALIAPITFVFTLLLACATQAQVALIEASPTTFDGKFNLALAANGGRVTASSEYSDDWAAHFVNDGLFAYSSDSLNSSQGWSSAQDPDYPVVLSVKFRGNQTAKISGFRFVPAGSYPTGSPAEFFVQTRRNGNLVDHGKLGMRGTGGPASWAFESPVFAEEIRFLITQDGGYGYPVIGELEVFEADHPGSFASGGGANLASPALGGFLVRYPTAPSDARSADNLIDDRDDTIWSPEFFAGEKSFTIAINQGNGGLISAVELHSPTSMATFPAVAEIALTDSENPLARFENVFSGPINWQNGTAEFPVDTDSFARFVRVTLQGSETDDAVLSEIRILEGAAEDYTSIALRPQVIIESGTTSAVKSFSKDASEPNDTEATSTLLEKDKTLVGNLWPETDNDYFLLDAASDQKSRISFEVETTSGAFASLRLKDIINDTPWVDFGAQATHAISDLEDGKYLLELSRPTSANIVLVFDRSGSMEQDIGVLEAAAREFINSKRDEDKIAMMSFGAGVANISDFETSKAVLNNSLDGALAAGGSTALYEAVKAATSLISQQRGDSAIVLITDGANTVNSISIQQAWDAIEATGVRFYTIALGGQLDAYADTMSLGASPSQLLFSWARASGGNFYKAPSSDELSSLYSEILNDIREPTTYTVRYGVQPILDGRVTVDMTGRLLAPDDAPLVELILDASGSMKERKELVDGQLKIDVAKSVLRDVVARLPDTANVGLRTFGHRVREGREGDCIDVELVVPHGRLNRGQMIASIDAVKPLGTTPLYNTVLLSVGDLSEMPAGKKLIVLLTDGIEECADPNKILTLSRLMREFDINLSMNVVGFSIEEEDTLAILEQAADLARGRFFDARNGQELANALLESFASLRYEVTDETGQAIAEGRTGDQGITLEEGVYGLRLKTGLGDIDIPGLIVTGNQTNAVSVDIGDTTWNATGDFVGSQ